MRGRVVKLDRGYPLVQLENDVRIRCEHATALEKNADMRAVIGDWVDVPYPTNQDKGTIAAIEPRSTTFVRRDPAQRTTKQVLAANFDTVLLAEPLCDINEHRLERSLVLAHQTEAQVAVVLTKADLAQDDTTCNTVCATVQDLAGNTVEVLPFSIHHLESIERIRALVPPNTTAILVGKSGAGKSSLVNALLGRDALATQDVRSFDGKGRHTTVARELVHIPDGGSICDMPGVRGLGLWESEDGLRRAFADVEQLAEHCHFRDCKHQDEPGCAVRVAVAEGLLAQARLTSYRTLSEECSDMRRRKDEADHKQGIKASDRKGVSASNRKSKSKSKSAPGLNNKDKNKARSKRKSSGRGNNTST